MTLVDLNKCFKSSEPNLKYWRSQDVELKYLRPPEITDVLKVWTDYGQFTLHSLVLAPHPLHFLNKWIRALWVLTIIHNLHTHTHTYPLFDYQCTTNQCTPVIRRTFWPGLWQVPPGARPSGSELPRGPWAPSSSSPPAAVWTSLMHSGRCPAKEENETVIKASELNTIYVDNLCNRPSASDVLLLRRWPTLSICSWASSTDKDCSSLSHPHNLVNTAWGGDNLSAIKVEN